jgi:hypothetical protein
MIESSEKWGEGDGITARVRDGMIRTTGLMMMTL